MTLIYLWAVLKMWEVNCVWHVIVIAVGKFCLAVRRRNLRRMPRLCCCEYSHARCVLSLVYSMMLLC